MTKTTSSFSTIAIILGLLFQAGAAEATTLARTWVSGAGDDTHACTRASPCATFGEAYLKTSVGGEIDILDGGDFGNLNIYHALTIANDGAGTAGIIFSGGPTLAIQAGPTDAVVLRGLSLNGVNSTFAGIQFTAGGSLLIDHCAIEGFQSHEGIVFAPSGAAKLWVADTVLSNDGRSSGASILIAPQNGAVATAHFEQVKILNAIGNGIRADGTQGGGGAIDVELHDVTVDGASGGSGIVAVSATSGGPAVNLMADSVTSSHNAGYGVRAVGATASVFLSRSTVTNNSIGIGASSGGVIASYADNRIRSNVNGDGSPTLALSLQ